MIVYEQEVRTLKEKRDAAKAAAKVARSLGISAEDVKRGEWHEYRHGAADVGEEGGVIRAVRNPDGTIELHYQPTGPRTLDEAIAITSANEYYNDSGQQDLQDIARLEELKKSQIKLLILALKQKLGLAKGIY